MHLGGRFERPHGRGADAACRNRRERDGEHAAGDRPRAVAQRVELARDLGGLAEARDRDARRGVDVLAVAGACRGGLAEVRVDLREDPPT